MEFDKTRKSIRADSIDDGSRKELLQKFTGAGGKVLQEKSLKKDSVGSDEKASGQGGKNRGYDQLPSQTAREKRRKEQAMQGEIQKQLAREEKEARSLINKFFIKLKARMSGVASYSSDVVKPGFLSLMNLDMKRALMEANILGHELLMLNPETGLKIIKELDKENPLLVELIEYATEIYDRSEINDLTQDYSSRPNQPVDFHRIKSPFFSLLRKLYAIRPYQETYLIAAEKAIDKQQEVEKKNPQLSIAKKKKIRAEWSRVFNVLFPQMAILAQRMELMKAEPGSRLFEEMIQYSPFDYPLGVRNVGDSVGKIAVMEKKEQKTEAKEDEKEEKIEEEPEAPEQAESGMNIMKSMTPEVLIRNYLTKQDNTKHSHKDKVFISYLYFRMFENEYSFIMSTSKMKLNTTFRTGEKLDMKRKMADHLENTRVIYDLYKKYNHENDEYQKALNDGAFTSNYVEHAKRMQLLEGRRANTGREFREKIKDFMFGLSDLLQILIDDIDKERNEILENRDEVLTFENVETANRLNNRTIEQAIRETNSFAKAFAFRLEEGDLFGGVLEMGDEQHQKAFPQMKAAPEKASSDRMEHEKPVKETET